LIAWLSKGHCSITCSVEDVIVLSHGQVIFFAPSFLGVLGVNKVSQATFKRWMNYFCEISLSLILDSLTVLRPCVICSASVAGDRLLMTSFVLRI